MQNNSNYLKIDLIEMERETISSISNDLSEAFKRIRNFSFEELSSLASKINNFDEKFVTVVAQAIWEKGTNSDIVGIVCCSKGNDNELRIELLQVLKNGKLGESTEKAGIGQLLFFACKFLAFKLTVDSIVIEVKNDPDLFAFLHDKSGFEVVNNSTPSIVSPEQVIFGLENIISSNLKLDIRSIVERDYTREFLSRNRIKQSHFPFLEKKLFWEMHMKNASEEIKIKASRVQQAIQEKFLLQTQVENLSNYFSGLSSS